MIAWRGRELDAEHADPGGEERHPDERQVSASRAGLEHDAERERGQDRAGRARAGTAARCGPGRSGAASRLAVSAVAETDAAAANSAITIPATGIVLVSMRGSSAAAARARYWLTISTTISASPPSSGHEASASRKRASAAPRRRRTRQRAARRRVRSRAGRAARSGLAGGVSSKVSSDSTNAPARDRRRSTQNSGRQAWALAWMPPIVGPSGDGAEDAHAHDHGGRAQLLRHRSRAPAAARRRSTAGSCTGPGARGRR